MQPSSLREAELVALGSLLDDFLWKGKTILKPLVNAIACLRPNLHVFGTGFIQSPSCYAKSASDRYSDLFFRNLKLHAVRGRLTRVRLCRAIKVRETDIALGDPGILSSLLLDGHKSSKEYALGIIPHYVDKDNDLLIKLHRATPHSIIIDVESDPLEVVNLIAKCEAIVSTAMHGLIVADSFAIPNKWIRVSDRIRGGDYKFHDYYSVFNVSTVDCVDLREEKNYKLTPQIISDEYRISKREVIDLQNKLMAAFPR